MMHNFFWVGAVILLSACSRLNIGNNTKIKGGYDLCPCAELDRSYALNSSRTITANNYAASAYNAPAKRAKLRNSGTASGIKLSTDGIGYKSYGGQVGLRQYFRVMRAGVVKPIRPYAEIRAGLISIDGINVRKSLGTGASMHFGKPFYKPRNVGTIWGIVGVETPIAKHTTIALETGICYTHNPGSGTSPLAGDNVLSASNYGKRLSVPLILRGRHRF